MPIAVGALLVVIAGCGTSCGTGCGRNASPDEPAGGPAEAIAPPQPTAAPTEPAGPTEEDLWRQKLADRVLAPSGLGVGGRLSAFDIVNCDSGDRYCQVCKFNGKPKIVAIGSPDDTAFHEDLKDLDAITKKYVDRDLRAFAVVNPIADGRSPTPSADDSGARETGKALRAALRLEMPVVIPAPEEDGKNRVWDEYYNVKRSRTIMFADAQNVIRYSAVAPQDFSELDAAIRKAVP